MAAKTANPNRKIALQQEAINIYRDLYVMLSSCFKDRDHNWLDAAAIDNNKLDTAHKLIAEALHISCVCLGFENNNTPAYRHIAAESLKKIKQRLDTVERDNRRKKTQQYLLQQSLTSWDSSQQLSEADKKFVAALAEESKARYEKNLCKPTKQRKKK